MEFSDVVKKFNKKIDISYYLKSMVSLCMCFINYNNRYQSSFEFIEKSKDGKDLDEDRISNMKDDLPQKSAKK